MLTEFLKDPVVLLLMVAAIGSFIGSVKLGSFSLNALGVLLTGLVLGHLGFVLPRLVLDLGLALFVYSVGLQCGPGFFDTFKKQGVWLGLMAVFMAAAGSAVLAVVGWLMGLSPELQLGIFCGAMNSALALASLSEFTSSPELALGFGVTFPVALAGMILFVRFMPSILRLDPDAERAAHEKRIRDLYPAPETRFFKVVNPACDGKTLKELGIGELTGAVVAAVEHGGHAATPDADLKLHLGDIVKMVGPPGAMNKCRIALGEETREVVRRSRRVSVRRILVSRKEVVGKTIGQLGLHEAYGATVTRIRRSGLTLTPTASTVLRHGDKLTVVASPANGKRVAELLGDDIASLHRANLVPAVAAMAVGAALGVLSIPLPFGLELRLGIAGGILFVALVVGRVGRVGPLLFSLPAESNQLLRKLGGLMLMAALGTQSGHGLVETLSRQGFHVIALCMLFVVVALGAGILFSRILLKHDLIQSVGAVAGGVASMAALEAGMTSLKSEHSAEIFAAVYPVALIGHIIVAQLLFKLLQGG